MLSVTRSRPYKNIIEQWKQLNSCFRIEDRLQ